MKTNANSIQDKATGFRRKAGSRMQELLAENNQDKATARPLKLSGNMMTIPINRETGECEVEEVTISKAKHAALVRCANLLDQATPFIKHPMLEREIQEALANLAAVREGGAK